jgi:hypothetical protein
MLSRDELHRTLKLELDEGRAQSVEQAEQLVRTYRLQIRVGADVRRSPSRQAALLTAINAGARAFLGGVHVTGDLEWPISAGWSTGLAAREAIEHLGGTVVEDVSDCHPTVVIGEVDEAAGSVVMQATWEGWAGGVVPLGSPRLSERVENALSGIVAGAVAVSEAFGHVRGAVTAGRQPAGISLWRPDQPWLDSDAAGPALRYLPTRLWLGGLGHLGQAYLWAIGFLPYRVPRDVLLMLQDYDHVVAANRSTGLLVRHGTPSGLLKTRIAAAAMEALGFSTRIVERAFDETTRPGPGEPTWVLAGFDNRAARACLGAFDLAVDVGLGSVADDFLGVHVHTFPAAGHPADVFVAAPPRAEAAKPAAWAVAAAKDRCGVLELQGAAVGAAFVGAFAGAFGVAEVLRGLAGAPVTAVGAVSLNALDDGDWVLTGQPPPINPGYQAAVPQA